MPLVLSRVNYLRLWKDSSLGDTVLLDKLSDSAIPAVESLDAYYDIIPMMKSLRHDGKDEHWPSAGSWKDVFLPLLGLGGLIHLVPQHPIKGPNGARCTTLQACPAAIALELLQHLRNAAEPEGLNDASSLTPFPSNPYTCADPNTGFSWAAAHGRIWTLVPTFETVSPPGRSVTWDPWGRLGRE